MLRFLLKLLQYWIPLALAVTIVCALVYVVVQQTYRQGANDPQVQIAKDSAMYLAKGYDPQSMVPTGNLIDVSKSLAPFIIIYDESGKVISTSVELEGKTPEIPAGVFDVVRKTGESRFTWEPKAGVRSAVVVVPYGGSKQGFVLSGRSLEEVEKRTFRLHIMVALAWLATLGATFIATFVLFFLPNFLPSKLRKLLF